MARRARTAGGGGAGAITLSRTAGGAYECETFDLYFRECFEQIAAFAAGRKLRLANPEVEGRAR
jgi:hypothetical protein